MELYRSLNLDRPRIRLVGVKCEGLREAAAAAEQLTLDLAVDPPTGSPGAVPAVDRGTVPAPPPLPSKPPARELDRAADAARARFGAAAVTNASLLGGPASAGPGPGMGGRPIPGKTRAGHNRVLPVTFDPANRLVCSRCTSPKCVGTSDHDRTRTAADVPVAATKEGFGAALRP